MKTKFNGFLTLLLALAVQLTFAQEKTVSGKVSDASGALPGVTVVVKGTNTGTQTDFDGNYSIKAKTGDVLVYSFIGMNPISKTVGASNTINVAMTESAEVLNEVVITAMGISKEKKALGYAVESLDGDEITEASVVNPMNALQGKVSGVDISTAPGPGATQNVIIRGASSFGSNQPLYVVDGSPLTNAQNRAGDNLNSQVDFGSGINAINPHDIENLTVLKGAAATALYGSRAANGVVMITTKKGKSGKLNVTFDSSYGVTQVGRLPDVQTQFGQGWSGDRALDENGNWGAAYDGVDRVWGQVINNSQQIKPYVFLDGTFRDFYEYGENTQNSLSLSGGSDTSNYFLSLSQSAIDGVIPSDKDTYKRYTIATRGSHTYNKLTISSSVNFSLENTRSVPSGQGTSVHQSLYEIANDISIVDLEDYKNNPFNTLDGYFTPYGVNPYYILDNDGAKQKKFKFFGKFQLDFDILENLKMSYRFGGDFETSTSDTHKGIIAFSPDSPNFGSSSETPGNYSEQRINRAQMDNDFSFKYNQALNANFDLNAIVGLNVNDRETNSLTGRITSIDVPGFYNLNNSLTPAEASHTHDHRRLVGLYASLDFSFRNYAYLNLTGRNDWSSTLPIDNNSFAYGGATLSFILTSFLKDQDVNTGIFNFTKLRVAYGSTGNDPEPYVVYDRYVPGYSTNPGFPDVDDLTFPLGGVNSYTASNVLGNSSIKPEFTTEFEVGIENSMLDNRIGFDFSYYNKFTEGLIAALPLDPSTGYTSITSNLGDVRNKGFEASLNLVPVKTENFTWDLNMNYSQNTNTVEKLDVGEVFLGGFGTGGIYAIEGKSLGQFKFAVAEKVDINGEEFTVVDGTGIPQHTTDQELLNKDINEKFRAGLTNTFTWKDLSLSATFDYRDGGYMFSGTKDYMHWTGSSPESILNDRNPFIIPNSVKRNADGSYSENTTPVDPTALHTFYSNGGLNGDDYAVIDKSYLKLRNITLAYNLPQSMIESLNVNTIRFSLTASNFLLWTPGENAYIDPETTTFGNDVAAKFGEFRANPTNETFTFALSINF
ncbi:SusC/RagA family TonB-linked outer membrane protein [Lutibacter sp. HS1-25]|uniref:SusC/RagA family TonB-linked outer membrane protein n=1 Tax=Lutibacter sp. HS1-25 TaxID=2485000 RepID=UPI001011A0E6|nr:SusC/RagA family TonB-linked outer membrane protein [Lutibacter sp. HS1-25]RXP58602.1 SusC/RagA family TonB-linked outer membrane protein [Lutibacter sp. HS1-25]